MNWNVKLPVFFLAEHDCSDGRIIITQIAEFTLDDGDDQAAVMVFDTKEKAREFLDKHGATRLGIGSIDSAFHLAMWVASIRYRYPDVEVIRVDGLETISVRALVEHLFQLRSIPGFDISLN